MIRVCNENGIAGKSESLIQFCRRNSKYLVLTRRHTGGIKKIELEELIRLKLLQIEERKKNQINYVQNMKLREAKRMGFRDKESFIEYIIRQANDDKSIVQSMIDSYSDKVDTLIEDLKSYGLHKRILTIGSFFTWPDVWDVCYFDVNHIDCRQFELDICTTPVKVGPYEFEDYGFANQEEVIWAKFCPHEEYFQLYLTEKQKAGFDRLRIPYHNIE